MPDCCVEHLVAAAGEDVAFSGDKQQLCEIDEFHQPTDAKDFAYCVVCGVSLCKLCMGDKYFPKTIHVRSKAGDSKETGFEVKSSPQCGCFVCHDCFEDKERYVHTLLGNQGLCVYSIVHALCLQAQVGMDDTRLPEAPADPQPQGFVEDGH